MVRQCLFHKNQHANGPWAHWRRVLRQCLSRVSRTHCSEVELSVDGRSLKRVARGVAHNGFNMLLHCDLICLYTRTKLPCHWRLQHRLFRFYAETKVTWAVSLSRNASSSWIAWFIFPTFPRKTDSEGNVDTAKDRHESWGEQPALSRFDQRVARHAYKIDSRGQIKIESNQIMCTFPLPDINWDQFCFGMLHRTHRPHLSIRKLNPRLHNFLSKLSSKPIHGSPSHSTLHGH